MFTKTQTIEHKSRNNSKSFKYKNEHFLVRIDKTLTLKLSQFSPFSLAPFSVPVGTVSVQVVFWRYNWERFCDDRFGVSGRSAQYRIISCKVSVLVVILKVTLNVILWMKNHFTKRSKTPEGQRARHSNGQRNCLFPSNFIEEMSHVDYHVYSASNGKTPLIKTWS